MEAKAQAAAIESLAKEKIKDYADLSKENQSMIRKVLREAEANGISKADALSYARVAARSGLDITFDKKACYNKEKGTYAAGFYDPEANRITVNPETKKKHAALLIHELSHAMRSYRTKGGEVKYFIDEDAKISEALKNEIEKQYADENGNIDDDLVADEASSYYAEAIFGTEGAIDLLLGEKPTLKQKILSFFKKSAQDYSSDEALSRESRKFLRNFKKAFDAFAARNRGRNAEAGNAGDQSARRYAFAGTNAETADRMNLSTAEKMLADGVDPETVRKETGWFKSYDGKWRFEISDFDSALIEKPNLTKHEDNREVYFTGKLSDVLNHKDLFAAYPKLKDINIIIQKTEFGVDAIYQPKSNYITLSIKQFKRRTKAYLDYLNGGRKAEIEKIEATPEYKAYNHLYDDEVTDSMEPEAWLKAEAEARDKFFSSELGKRYYQLMWGKNGFAGETFELGWGDAAKEVLIHELQHAIQSEEGFASGTNTRDANYDRNAGEIEARDSAKRIKMTDEERKNTRPDIDRTDVVLKGGTVSYLAKNEYDAEKASIHEQIREHQHELNQLPVAFAAKLPYKVGKAYEAGTWAIGEMKKYGYQVDRQGFGKVYFDEEDIRDAMKYLDTDEEKISIVSIYKVLKRGIQIGEHGNHKNRGKHTITFAAPVEINGVRGNVAVVVNMRNNRYKVHRILMPDGSIFKFDEKLKNNAEQEMQRGVPKGSLANATSSASNPIIPDSTEKINPSDEISLEKSSDSRRYAMEDIDPAAVALPRKAGTMSVGQYKKRVADLMKTKSYSKDQIYDIVKKLPMADMASEKTREQITEAVWQIYNEQLTASERQEAARDISLFLVARLMTEAKVDNPLTFIRS